MAAHEVRQRGQHEAASRPRPRTPRSARGRWRPPGRDAGAGTAAASRAPRRPRRPPRRRRPHSRPAAGDSATRRPRPARRPQGRAGRGREAAWEKGDGRRPPQAPHRHTGVFPTPPSGNTRAMESARTATRAGRRQRCSGRSSGRRSRSSSPSRRRRPRDRGPPPRPASGHRLRADRRRRLGAAAGGDARSRRCCSSTSCSTPASSTARTSAISRWFAGQRTPTLNDLTLRRLADRRHPGAAGARRAGGDRAAGAAPDPRGGVHRHRGRDRARDVPRDEPDRAPRAAARAAARRPAGQPELPVRPRGRLGRRLRRARAADLVALPPAVGRPSPCGRWPSRCPTIVAAVAPVPRHAPPQRRRRRAR